ANRQQAVEAEIKKIAPICELTLEDPAEGEQPPTFLVNKSYVRPFESIVKMFSMPDPNGFDPTFIMMPFWVCFFGMMVSDAAYGIILGVAASYIYVKLRGRGIGQMAFILALGGLSTVFWGAMYGGWFSIEGIPALLLVPMEDPIGMLALCMGLGALHLFTGLGVAAYMNIRRGKPLDALLDQGSWMMLLIGLALLAVSKSLGMVLSIAGAAGIVLFARRDKPNFFKRILGGLGALYGVSGYLSDLLSYARLFGMGLATGVIGMVFNTLAGMMWGSPAGSAAAILILVVGHTFNLFINALGAYVHSCRLQFIEFFGKFYEMGGRDFSPLAVNGRYVDIRGEEF
ncbi:MAG: V-type ATP synthase subunit I, partial [Eubacteriales bacterium]|nr:V-type ATP synthase subunit I [Eubacteriales bacterium]